MKRTFLFIILVSIFLVSSANKKNRHDPDIRFNMQTGIKHSEPEVSINNVTVTEAEGSATLTVSLSRAANLPVRVHYKTEDGTAKNKWDYRKKSGDIVIAAELNLFMRHI